MIPVYIGVDPAFRKGGFWACVIDMTDKSARWIEFEDLLTWHDWLRSDDAPESAFVCIENSNMQNQNFDMTGGREELARKGRNVGTNQAVSELAYRSAVRRYGARVVFQVSPKEKGRKYQPAEFTAVMRSDGIVPPSKHNQDQRDAYKLAAIARRKSIISYATR